MTDYPAKYREILKQCREIELVGVGMLLDPRIVRDLVERAAALDALEEPLRELMRIEPYVYEGRLEASLTVPVWVWERLQQAIQAALKEAKE